MEEKTVDELFEEELCSQIKGLGSLELGSKQLDTAVNNVVALYKARTDFMRMEADVNDKRENIAYRDIQLMDAKKDRVIKIVMSGTEIILPLAVYTFLVLAGFKFEFADRGIISSTTLRNLFNQIKIKKK